MQKPSKRLLIFISFIALATAIGFAFNHWKKNLIQVGNQGSIKRPTAEQVQMGLMPQFKKEAENSKINSEAKEESSLKLKNLNPAQIQTLGRSMDNIGGYMRFIQCRQSNFAGEACKNYKK